MQKNVSVFLLSYYFAPQNKTQVSFPSNSAGGEEKMTVGGYMGGIFGSSPVSPLQKHMSKVYACASELIPLFNAVINEDWDEVAKHQQLISQLEEEADVLKKNNLEWKQVAKECSHRVRQYFFSKIDKIE